MVCSLKMEGSNRKMNHYPALAKNYSIPPCLLVLVSISLRWSLSFSSFLVVLALGVSRGRLAYLKLEVVSLFRFVGELLRALPRVTRPPGWTSRRGGSGARTHGSSPQVRQTEEKDKVLRQSCRHKTEI
jgi:hypothetical protein